MDRFVLPYGVMWERRELPFMATSGDESERVKVRVLIK